MSVNLNLSTKPQQIVLTEERKSNKYVLLFFVLALIYISSFPQILMLSYNLYELNDKKTMVNSQILKKEKDLLLITKELKELSDNVESRTESISFVMQGLPVPEILLSLAKTNNRSIIFDCVTAQEDKITILGSCDKKANLIELSDTLVKNNIFMEKPDAEFTEAKSSYGLENSFIIKTKICILSEMYERK